MAAAIAVSDVSKRFPTGTLALDDCSMTVAAGEFVALVGPSGCGKSTALRLMAGLERPGSGSIVIDPALVRSFVFQEPTLMPWASVADNVWLPLRLAGRSRDEARADVDAALAAVGLTGFAAAYPRELSGGMKMRASIARALVSAPRLLLMDEPFAALDEITRERLNDDLLALWQTRGLTVVFVTHSVVEAAYLSQRVLVMSERPGRVVAEVPIDAPYPRGEAWRTSQRHAQCCAALSRALRSAQVPAPSGAPAS
jgi:NitT/TauT family transport system ATP-binding protein